MSTKDFDADDEQDKRERAAERVNERCAKSLLQKPEMSRADRRAEKVKARRKLRDNSWRIAPDEWYEVRRCFREAGQELGNSLDAAEVLLVHCLITYHGIDLERACAWAVAHFKDYQVDDLPKTMNAAANIAVHVHDYMRSKH